MKKLSMKLVAKGHFTGRNQKGDLIDLIKGTDGLWYAYKNGKQPAISIFRGDSTFYTVVAVLA